MNRRHAALPALLLLGALLAPAAASAQQAEASRAELRAGALVFTAPWVRAAGPGQNSAGYLTLRNTGTEPDRLLAAETPAARVVELHTTLREGDVMRMRPVEAILLPPGQTVRLAPGGLHIMLIGLNRPLQRGEPLPLTLRFERAGVVELRFAVEAAGAREPAHRH